MSGFVGLHVCSLSAEPQHSHQKASLQVRVSPLHINILGSGIIGRSSRYDVAIRMAAGEW